MGFLFTLFAPPLGIIMRLCYSVAGNVGIAIIVFTIIVRIAMFPLSIKQHKTTSKTQMFTPRIREIQQKYRGNNQKMQEEMAKLQREGYNPAAGCLPMVLTMLILFGVLGVVYKPLTYFESVPGVQIQIIEEIAKEVERKNGVGEDELNRQYATLHAELRAIGVYKNNTDEFKKINAGRPALKEAAVSVFTAENADASQEQIESFRRSLSAIKYDALPDETLETLDRIEKQIVFGGIDFSQIPSRTWPIIIIPILSFIFAAGHMVVMQIIQRRTSPEAVKQQGSMKYLFYFMPILSLVIAFQFPAGAGFCFPDRREWPLRGRWLRKGDNPARNW